MPEGTHFLDKNTVVIKGGNVTFSKSDISTYITQSPHRVRFPNRFTTWLYYVTEDKTDRSFWNWVNEYIARTPEYYDADASLNSTKQIKLYLDNIGYFNSKVTHELKPYWLPSKRHRIKSIYTVYPSQPYTISEIHYHIEDTVVAGYVERIKDRLPVKENELYNAYTLDDERNVITNMLRNVGYYYFTRDYISYEIDSSFRNHTLEVTLKIDNVKDRHTNKLHPHKKYFINQINIYPNYIPSQSSLPPTDSTTITFNSGFRNATNTLHFYFHETPRIRPSTFTQIIQIYQGRPYRQSQVTQTYSALSSLKMFANSSIEFDTVSSGNDSINLLNCNIMLRRADTHSLKLQTEATNSGGDLGISGSITYTNKNIFKGAEVLTVSVKGGLEAQEIIYLGDVNDDGRLFNTGELILNSSIYFPRFLSPIPLKTFVREYQPRTTYSLGGSAQVRYAYSRYIIMSSFGYDWKTNPRLQFILSPIYLNLVKVNPIPEFQAVLDLEHNQRIKDQYTNHLIFGGRYSLVYNSQDVNRSSNYVYLRGTIESSGNLLSLFNHTPLITNSDDHYELMGIRYAQFLRGDVDFRQYIRLGEETRLVFRQLIGIGFPYGNSYDMPFERSFYSGGSTGMRGWDYRKLGPGAYNPTEDNGIERIGDIQLECNAEIRFPIYHKVKGAVFADAGNIWNYHENELLPGGGFQWGNFYQQIAVDAGFGLRFDLNIAIIRLDMAMPIRNPYANANGEHWRFHDMSPFDLHLVFNIGYPF